MKNTKRYILSFIMIIIFGLSAIGSVDTDSYVGSNNITSDNNTTLGKLYENYNKNIKYDWVEYEGVEGDIITITGLSYLDNPVYYGARLLPYPDYMGDDFIIRMPKGTQLVIKKIRKIHRGMKDIVAPVYWFKVEYKQKVGWVSIFCTDADYDPYNNNF